MQTLSNACAFLCSIFVYILSVYWLAGLSDVHMMAHRPALIVRSAILMKLHHC